MVRLGRATILLIVIGTLALLAAQAPEGRAQGPQPQSAQVALGTAFSYQGQLARDGSQYTGICDFQFSLWDSNADGTQLGATLNRNAVEVNNGLFAVSLDFGNLFTGEARWLTTTVQCAGDGAPTTLAPRTALGPVPYALSLAPGAIVSGTGALGLQVNTPNGNAIVGYSERDGYAAIAGIDSYVDAFYGSGYGVYGMSQMGYGVYGKGPVGVWGDGSGASDGDGVWGWSDSGTGVYGSGNIGVEGYSGNHQGVYGSSGSSRGVHGYSASGVGVYGSTSTGKAGYFNGDVHIQGTLSKNAGSFKIDHPLDPANKYLSHSFVESPDMLNIYNGNVTTDAHGNATIVLPAYFEALNKDFTYQLTVIGTFAQVTIASKIQENQFRIKTDKPNVEVSWQVTGIRKDPYAEAHRIVVEADKPAKEQGLYQFPELYGEPAEKGIDHADRTAIPAKPRGIGGAK